MSLHHFIANVTNYGSQYNKGLATELWALWGRNIFWRLFLRNDLRYFETEATSSSGVQQHRFQLFRLEAEVVHRPVLANVRFRGSDPVGVHVCTFQFTVIPVDTQHQKAIQDSASTGEFTHLMFFRQLKNMCKLLSSEELEHFISHPEQIDELFARAKHLETKEEPILGWKKSPGVITTLLPTLLVPYL
ncbi:hypothetical protein BDZ97DRAFT_1770168 [Flammula alnicola]|nr:hypothetical protein BDZ97DRAFT_1770168 [Flammula alnicola]